MKQLSKVWVAILMGLAAVFIYTVLHEGGHALAVLVQGGRVTAFDVNFLTSSPKVSWTGDFSEWGRAVVSLAGPVLPVLVWLPLVPFLPCLRSKALKLLLAFFSINLLGTLVPQVFLPLAQALGANVAGEDIIMFIHHSGWNPYLVSALFTLILGFSAWYLWHVGRIKTVSQELLAKSKEQPLSKGQSIAAGIGVIALMVFIAVGITSPQAPLEDYHTKLELDFSDFNDTTTKVYEFSIDEITVYDFVYSIDVDTPVQLRLATTNPSGFVFNSLQTVTIYQEAGKLTNAHFTGFILEPGDYYLELEAPERSGELVMYIASREANQEALEYLEIQRAVSAGTFTPETFQDPGYTLVYHGSLEDYKDPLFQLEQPGYIQVSAFVVGDYSDIQLSYHEDNWDATILKDFNVTIGFGFNTSTQGDFRLSATDASGDIYIFIKH